MKIPQLFVFRDFIYPKTCTSILDPLKYYELGLETCSARTETFAKHIVVSIKKKIIIMIKPLCTLIWSGIAILESPSLALIEKTLGL